MRRFLVSLAFLGIVAFCVAASAALLPESRVLSDGEMEKIVGGYDPCDVIPHNMPLYKCEGQGQGTFLCQAMCNPCAGGNGTSFQFCNSLTCWNCSFENTHARQCVIGGKTSCIEFGSAFSPCGMWKRSPCFWQAQTCTCPGTQVAKTPCPRTDCLDP